MQSNALAKRYTEEPVVMFIHIDRITQPVGSVEKNIRNGILKLVSERLIQLKRESDTLAYVDKNEFAFILENVHDENAIQIIADRLLKAVRKPVELNEKSFLLHATISLCKIDSDQYIKGLAEISDVFDILVDRKVVAVL